MAAGKGAGHYRDRVLIIPRTLGAAAANGQRPETWAAADGRGWWAAVEAPSGSETIAAGLQMHTQAARVRFRGKPPGLAATDRVRVNATGVVYAVVGLWADDRDAIALCQSVPAGV